MHWQSISKNNITTINGRSSQSRIQGPGVSESAPSIFSELICVSNGDGIKLKKSKPSSEFEYSQATIQDNLKNFDPDKLENLPQVLSGGQYQRAEIDGEAISSILIGYGNAWLGF